MVVPDYQLSLAIGKEGQNARLAARLTGFKIDIKSETQAREDGDFMDYENDYEDEDYEDYEEGDYEEDGYQEESYEEGRYQEGDYEEGQYQEAGSGELTSGESIKEEYEESSDDVSEVEGEEHYDE